MAQKFFSVLTIFFMVMAISCGGGGTNSGGGGNSFKQKIVFSGASSIARGDWSSYFGVPIINNGVSGIESSELVGTIEGQISIKPNKIFIMIGANNILNRHEGSLVGDISAIIDKIKIASPGTAIFIMSILPVKSDFSNSLIESHNNQIQSLCGRKNVKFIFLYSLFKNPSTIVNLNYYIDDGIQLTETGYRVWANAIRGDVLS